MTSLITIAGVTMCKLRRNKREEEDDDEEEVKEDKDKGLPVDRGWAWVIVAGNTLYIIQAPT